MKKLEQTVKILSGIVFVGILSACAETEFSNPVENKTVPMVKSGEEFEKVDPKLPKPVVPKEQSAVKKTYQKPGISISRVECGKKVVALTFDDGPHPSLTPRLLEILKRENVPATFFVLGKNVVLYPKIIKAMDEQGCEIGNHTWNHPLLTKYGAESVRNQLEKTHQAVKNITGKDIKVARPPYGALRKEQRIAVNKDWGYRIILWDVDPLDWKKPGSRVVADRLASKSRPGSVLLAHDIHAGTIEAIPEAIRQLKAAGYEFVTVSQLIKMGEDAASIIPTTLDPQTQPVEQRAIPLDEPKSKI